MLGRMVERLFVMALVIIVGGFVFEIVMIDWERSNLVVNTCWWHQSRWRSKDLVGKTRQWKRTHDNLHLNNWIEFRNNRRERSISYILYSCKH